MKRPSLLRRVVAQILLELVHPETLVLALNKHPGIAFVSITTVEELDIFREEMEKRLSLTPIGEIN